MDRLIKLLNGQLPWVTMMILITIQSAMTSTLLVKLPSGMDKFIHFLIFFVLGWLMTRGMYDLEKISLPLKWLIILAGGALFALLDEWHQSLVPGRVADTMDWLADMAGIISAGLWYYYLNGRNKNVTALTPE